MSAPPLAPEAPLAADRGPQARDRLQAKASKSGLPLTSPGQPPSQRAQARAAAGTARAGAPRLVPGAGGQGVARHASPRWRGEGAQAALEQAGGTAGPGAISRPSTVGAVRRGAGGRGTGRQLPGIVSRRHVQSRGAPGAAGGAAGRDSSRAASVPAGLSQASAASLESSAYAALWDVGIHLAAREPADDHVQAAGGRRSMSRRAGASRGADAPLLSERWEGRPRGPRMTGHSRGTVSAAQLEAASRARTPLVGVPWTGSDTDLPPLRGTEGAAWSVAIEPEHTHHKGSSAPRDAPSYGGESKAVS